MLTDLELNKSIDVDIDYDTVREMEDLKLRVKEEMSDFQ